MSSNPSGEQYEIGGNGLRAVIVQVGGGLRTLSVDGLELLDGYPVDEMCHDARGQLLIPWPNRLAGGKYTFDGTEYQLPITEPSYGNAIHGLVRWTNWMAEAHSENRIVMTHRLYPMPGYPFTLDLAAEYALTADGLHVTLRATNSGSSACPFGAGHHPYLRVGTPLIDSASLGIPARTMYRYNKNLIPTEQIPVQGTPLDFQTMRPIGETEINMDYTNLARDADGLARVRVDVAEDGPSLVLWMDEAFKHVTVYTGETVQPASRRRHGLAIEPMTCPPNAFATGDDLVVLSPGESWQGNWGLSIGR